MQKNTKQTKNHAAIRAWVQKHHGAPARIKGTSIIRLDVPGFSNDESLEHISWNDFFDVFDERRLALIHDENPNGTFNKLIYPETNNP